MKAVKGKAVSGLIVMVFVAVLGLLSLGASFGCDSYYDPYWDINAAALYRQAETDIWADMWDWEIRTF